MCEKAKNCVQVLQLILGKWQKQYGNSQDIQVTVEKNDRYGEAVKKIENEG